MRPRVNSPDLLNFRALLVVAMLTCLCISSNVGLQFFPLPATSHVLADVQQDQHNKASHAPRSGAQSFRVPMMVQSRKDADKAPPQCDPLVALPSDRFGLSTDTRFALEADYTVPFVESVTMAPRGGRAPPSLV